MNQSNFVSSKPQASETSNVVDRPAQEEEFDNGFESEPIDKEFFPEFLQQNDMMNEDPLYNHVDEMEGAFGNSLKFQLEDGCGPNTLPCMIDRTPFIIDVDANLPMHNTTTQLKHNDNKLLVKSAPTELLNKDPKSKNARDLKPLTEEVCQNKTASKKENSAKGKSSGDESNDNNKTETSGRRFGREQDKGNLSHILSPSYSPNLA